MSRRELEVASLVAEGMTNRQIAAKLFVSERTAEFHVEQIRNKLGFQSRTQVARWFQEGGAGFGPKSATAGGNLPVPLTSFVGRNAEVAEIRRLLDQGRLVTLAGPPGIGKTRLALEVAREVGAGLPGGSWIVELAPIADGARVAEALALTLAITEQPGRSIAETVAAAIHDRQILLVLDNCEHLLDAVAALAETLLRAGPGVRLLATTRERLRVPGEIVYRVPPLAEAESLFHDRALQSAPDFEWSPAVADLCRHLEGIPLAIELAAGRVSLMSVEDMAAGFHRSLQLLTSGSRTAMRRQQSLRAAIESSHQLLTPPERMLFARLSVFVGGFELEAAESVCDDGSGRVAELLLSLADKSLVWSQSSPGRPTRFRLLETLRQYAAERLGAGEAADSVRRRHLEHYTRLAESLRARAGTPGRAMALDRLQEEMGNVWAALAWTAARDPEAHLRLAVAADPFWLMRAPTGVGRAVLESALASATHLGKVRADALWAVSMLSLRQSDLDAARRYNLEAMDLYRELEDWPQLARVLNNLATGTADRPRRAALLAEGLETARRSKDPAVIGLLLLSGGGQLRAEGRLGEARAMLEESVALRRQAGHDWGVQQSLVQLAHLDIEQNDATSAGAHLQEALRLVLPLGDRSSLANVLEGFARLSSQPGPALRLAGAARALRQQTGDAVTSSASLDSETVIAEARRRLGGDADMVEAAGYGMSIDHAVEEALAIDFSAGTS